jgi:hypothetical protein
VAHTRREQIQDVLHADPETPNAGTPPALLGTAAMAIMRAEQVAA